MTAVYMQSPADELKASVKPDNKKKISEDEVQAALHMMVSDAVLYVDSELSPERAVIGKYLKGEPYGNEEEGRSQVVTTELRDTILQVMPSLLRVFFGSEQACEYRPRRPDQVRQAEDATNYVWDVVVKEDNRGFLVFYEWFKDALAKRLGIVKYWYDDAEEKRGYSASYLSVEALTLLDQDPEIEIDSVSPCKSSPPGALLYDVEYTQTKNQGRIRFIAMPPEEFIFSRGARTTDSDARQPGVAVFVGHRTELTKSQLLSMGVDEKDIDEYGFTSEEMNQNAEEVARLNNIKPGVQEIGPEATQKVLYIEGYPYLDVDGDGIAELRRVIMLGPNYHVVENEPADERPFAVLCPDPEPHTIIGQSYADYTMDLQKITSMIVRSMLDSLALSITPRMGYVEGDVSLEDVLNTQIGAPIRMRQQGALQEITHSFVGRDALQVLDYIQRVRENRTGSADRSSGMDASELQSTTQAAVQSAVESAHEHIEMIARVFSETGVRKLFSGILRLLVENQDQPRMARVNGRYTQMDPRGWDANLDISVNVGLGGGTTADKVAILSETALKQEQILQTMGLGNPLVTPKQYRDTLVKTLKLRGRMDAESFYQEVPENWQPPPPPQQDPNMVIAQAEVERAKADVAKKQADVQLEAKKHEVEIMRQAEDLRIREKDIDLTDEREREKIEAEIALQIREMNLKYNAQVTAEQIHADIEQQRVELDAEVAKHKADVDAEAKSGKGVRRHRIEHDEKGRISVIETEEGNG